MLAQVLSEVLLGFYYKLCRYSGVSLPCWLWFSLLLTSTPFRVIIIGKRGDRGNGRGSTSLRFIIWRMTASVCWGAVISFSFPPCFGRFFLLYHVFSRNQLSLPFSFFDFQFTINTWVGFYCRLIGADRLGALFPGVGR